MKTNKIWTIKDKELLNLIIGRDGGNTTVKIIDQILECPQNANQLSRILNLGYNTITHHVNIVNDHKYITKIKFDNVFYYYPSEKLLNNLYEYNIIKEYLKIKK